MGVGARNAIEREDCFGQIIQIRSVLDPRQDDGIPIARYVVDGEHPRVRCDFLLHVDHSSFLDTQSSHDGHCPSELTGVERHTVTLNHTLLLKAPDSIGHGSLSEAKFPCELSVADACIVAEQLEQGTVRLVKVHGAHTGQRLLPFNPYSSS